MRGSSAASCTELIELADFLGFRGAAEAAGLSIHSRSGMGPGEPDHPFPDRFLSAPPA